MTNFAIIIELLYTKTRSIHLLTSLVFIRHYFAVFEFVRPESLSALLIRFPA